MKWKTWYNFDCDLYEGTKKLMIVASTTNTVSYKKNAKRFCGTSYFFRREYHQIYEEWGEKEQRLFIPESMKNVFHNSEHILLRKFEIQFKMSF